MASLGPTAQSLGAVRDHGYHPLRIARVVHETADARSFVFEVPRELEPSFAYVAGQFCTFRAHIDGQTLFRCYSMSSSPDVDAELQVTVKRVPGGVVSNWMIDTLMPGDLLDSSVPTGRFCLDPSEQDGAADRAIVAFGAGSGITPIFSVLKSALATTARRVQLLYANRDPDAVIFRAALDALVDQYDGRFEVIHHFDVDQGFVGPDELRPVVEDAAAADADVFICGPGPFMDVVERTLHAHAVAADRIHIERFTPVESESPPHIPVATPEGSPVTITIELTGRTAVAEYRPGTTILQTARQTGMSPPFSCESGNCATCMAKIVEGSASMYVNDALTADEVADGWVLTCQAVPTSPSVHVIYGY
jgi:3-ketosteroid 9alpha-monooxygenase subunit B